MWKWPYHPQPFIACFGLVRPRLHSIAKLPRRVKSSPLSARSTLPAHGSCWLETARQFSTEMCWEDGSARMANRCVSNYTYVNLKASDTLKHQPTKLLRLLQSTPFRRQLHTSLVEAGPPSQRMPGELPTAPASVMWSWRLNGCFAGRCPPVLACRSLRNCTFSMNGTRCYVWQSLH